MTTKRNIKCHSILMLAASAGLASAALTPAVGQSPSVTSGRLIGSSGTEIGGVIEFNPDGSNTVNLTSNTFDSFIAGFEPSRSDFATFSTDGRYGTLESNSDGNFRIYSMAGDGSNVRQLTTSFFAPQMPTGEYAQDRYPEISPDGRRVAFISNRSGVSDGSPTTSDIYIVDIPSDSAAGDPINPIDPIDPIEIGLIPQQISTTQINPDGTSGMNSSYRSVAWSPDGTKLAFRAMKYVPDSPSTSGWHDCVGYMNADGTNEVDNIVDDPGQGSALAWSPDGNIILYSVGGNSDLSTTYELYNIVDQLLIPITSDQLTATTPNASGPVVSASGTAGVSIGNGSVRFSPDGLSIVYGEGEGECIYNIQTQTLTPILQNAMLSGSPIWWQQGAAVSTPAQFALVPEKLVLTTGQPGVAVIPTLTDASGAIICHGATAWQDTGNPGLGTGGVRMSITGQFTGTGTGEYVSTIQASNAGLTASIPVIVNSPAISSVSVPDNTVGGAQVQGTVTLATPAPFDTTIKLTSNGPIQAPESVVVKQGQTSATFNVTTSKVDENMEAEVTGSDLSSSQTGTFHVVCPTITSVGFSLGNTVIGGGLMVGEVTVSAPVPVDYNVGLICETDGVSIPEMVTIHAGAVTNIFPIHTSPVTENTSAVITARNSGSSQNTTLYIRTDVVNSLGLSNHSTTITGGDVVTGVINLVEPSPESGVTVQLTSNNPAVTVPASVLVKGTSGTFQITTHATAVSTPVTVAASTGLSLTIANIPTGANLQLTINPPYPTTVSLQHYMVGGTTSQGIVYINDPAPAGGLRIKLLSSVPSVLSVPEYVTVPAGQHSVTFGMSTASVTSTTPVKVTALGIYGSASQVMPIVSATIASLSLNQSTVYGGNSCIATVTLSAPAPQGGAVVSVTTLNSEASAPATVTVPAGKTSVQFTVNTKLLTSAAAVSTGIAAATQTNSQSAPLSVQSIGLKSVQMPASVFGGMTGSGTVTLKVAAPTGGIAVQLRSSDPSLVLPATVTVPAGKTSATFPYVTRTVRKATVPVTTASISTALFVQASTTVKP